MMGAGAVGERHEHAFLVQLDAWDGFRSTITLLFYQEVIS